MTVGKKRTASIPLLTLQADVIMSISTFYRHSSPTATMKLASGGCQPAVSAVFVGPFHIRRDPDATNGWKFANVLETGD
jgi:hypothetical protein